MKNESTKILSYFLLSLTVITAVMTIALGKIVVEERCENIINGKKYEIIQLEDIEKFFQKINLP